MEPTQPALTRVNGIGQWNAWTRNFNSPLLAMLDLFDNSIDAAMKPKRSNDAAMTGNDSDDDDEDYRGRVEVQADRRHHSMLGNGDDSDGSDEDYNDVDGAPLDTITGICLTNNSYRQIKPLEKILEAYSSAKGREEHGDDHDEGDFAETIGENGVGLKQGCAVLSNLSFVLIRRGDGDANKFSLGVIAKQLQRPEGISLPSMEFVSHDLASLKEEMSTLFTGTAVGECVTAYGAGSLTAGINRLLCHFQQMMSSKRNDEWGHFGQVFRVVLHDVKGSGNSDSTALSLMDELNTALPSTYIHLPDNVEVKVHGEVVQFHHYQSRLIELAAFYQKIDTSTPVGGDGDWQHPEQGYNLRLLLGFDASRKGGRPKLCIHSRHSGRLVKSVEDCRAVLGLTTGSTDFCQGLTVIVDDMFGHLPLNPTKQDIAFGEQEAGDVHKTNLFSWIGAYAYLYYNVHRDKRFGGSKMALSAGISRIFSQQDAVAWDGPSLDECVFTEYKFLTWKFIKATGNIRCGNMKKVSAVAGEDTRWRFDEVAEAAHAASPSQSNPRPKKKRNTAQLRGVNQGGGVPAHDLMLPGSSIQVAVRTGLSRERNPTNSGADFQTLYEELKKEHGTLEKEHEKLREKYQGKRDHKKTAKEYAEKSEKLTEEVEQLEKLLDIERRRRKEELEEKEEELEEKDKDLRAKDETVERLERRNRRLEERIKSLDSICSPRGSRQVSL